MTAPSATKHIKNRRRGPTFSPKTNQPIKAAKTTEVSRSTAASPTLSNRVASKTPPKLIHAISAPTNPRHTKGPRTGWFGLSISLGVVTHQNTTYYCIGLQTPIGKLLFGKQVGDTFCFRDTTYRIKSIV